MGCNTSKESVQPAVEEAKEGDSVKNGDISKAAENSAEASNEGNENAEEDKEKEAAATKIQAVFRGHHARKSLRVSETASKETKTDEEPSEPTQEQLQEEFRADDQELCDAAKKIQATFRGHMSRKEATTAAKSAMNMVESATAKIEEKKLLYRASAFGLS
ncbi:Uncharacterized protein DBV15_00051 [Temnothorax longispinosus]|uniref:Uncharacterized protein n=1 Tax=Temnothorax longispinosus TaxID=300112 RepID=A0A4S2KHU5_9HYME|nr:Uncharacterized protein DBV15_00051 [Temnothorax longispinosus]